MTAIPGLPAYAALPDFLCRTQPTFPGGSSKLRRIGRCTVGYSSDERSPMLRQISWRLPAISSDENRLVHGRARRQLSDSMQLGMNVASLTRLPKFGNLSYSLRRLYVDEFLERQSALLPEGCGVRSEEHTSELQSLMRISYAVFC